MGCPEPRERFSFLTAVCGGRDGTKSTAPVVLGCYPEVNLVVMGFSTTLDNENPVSPIVAAYVLFHQNVDLATAGVHAADTSE